ncbi:nitric oxide reductase, NorZ apoprotein [Capnocytophaga haemolytica]|uniref:Nitric oxide reductase large subunit n=1 Tax=Capnocytophaga haemolytica TaxID=45243 RepID=A0AAX2GW30_9FLAO|nr:nitric-oxide reductase large subunit [Capnocytophaga haemolytica]AMD84978.1 nitric oxide reductase large subunit [Capnocytophaga haemolytica]SFO28008.1 nitric oxide reductase, NorZ apoprotein [Capnocytophaga haemolytica]SNV06005.1 Nitric oxide reductase subunit B [Capnocytophaga haemolytica]
MTAKKLWMWLGATVGASFLVLIFYGVEIYTNIPPFPERIVTTDGQVLYEGQDIKDGQNVWQSMGGQTVGSIWGHGAYIAPDWNADYLHRESEMLLDAYAREDGKVYKDLSEEEQAKYQVRLRKELRTNTFNQETGVITFSAERAEVAKQLSEYYAKLFMDDPSMQQTRAHYAIPKNAIKDRHRMDQMSAFFAWSTWVCSTNRPGDHVSYTNNWPYDPVVGNVASTSLQMWSGFSVLMLLFAVGILVYYHASNNEEEETERPPVEDPMRGMKPTPSMKAVLKYIWIVALLILVQMLAGVITAHYGVEGEGFFGLQLDLFLPQAISRSWHVQLAIFWIATSWLATGLYIAPAVSGHEPKYQKLGVNVLFGALLIVVLGSLAGQWFGVMQKLGLVENFYFGHQGYEYIELGRFWQILLLVGLFLWLFLMIRALLPALKRKDENRHLLLLFTLASIAIAAFYGAGLMYGRQTHMAIAEYWRWWVVHLWVEGFFEVFATVVAAFLFSRMGLLRIKAASTAVLFSTIVFLAGGILGTFHHLYFSATPTGVLALGATFSALEIVPLVLIGYEAYHNYKLSKAAEWVQAYKWPIYCFIAMCFWNFLGAGIFGFAINPPIALYYVQGLNTTAVHGHAALFGVYGILGIGLIMFVLRGLYPDRQWNDKLISWAFWLINIGLLVMLVVSLLPVGIMQAIEVFQHGYWSARSEEFMQQDHMQIIRWLRIPGDLLLAFGELLLVYFIVGLQTGWSLKKKR